MSTSAIDASPSHNVGPVYGTAFGQRVPEAQQEVVVDVTDGALAEQVLELVEHEQQAGAGGEADDDRVRDVTREVAEPGQADGELDGADHERQQDGELQPSGSGHRPHQWRRAARSRSRWSGR